MLILLLFCLLIGAVLGQRFKVLVLIPAMVPVLAVAAGSAHAGTVWQILGAAVVAATSLQIGYFVGVGIRHLIATARTSRINADSHTTSPRQAITKQI